MVKGTCSLVEIRAFALLKPSTHAQLVESTIWTWGMYPEGLSVVARARTGYPRRGVGLHHSWCGRPHPGAIRHRNQEKGHFYLLPCECVRHVYCVILFYILLKASLHTASSPNELPSCLCKFNVSSIWIEQSAFTKSSNC